MLSKKPKRHRFPVEIISYVIWSYHRFNDSLRDVSERLRYRGILISHETIRTWSLKFGSNFKDVIKKRESKPNDKWHLDEMSLKINKERFYLWRAVDADGYELEVLLQKRRNKKAAIRFLTRVLNSHPEPRIIVTDKLRSYNKPIQQMCKNTEHRKHRGLNNRVENSHQPTRRKEKILIKFKSPKSVQQLLSLMGKVRNIFAVNVGRYSNFAQVQKDNFFKAKEIWDAAALKLLYA